MLGFFNVTYHTDTVTSADTHEIATSTTFFTCFSSLFCRCQMWLWRAWPMICQRERRCCYGAGAPWKVIPESRSRISLRHGVMDAPSSPLYTDTGEWVKVILKYRSSVTCSIKDTQLTLKKTPNSTGISRPSAGRAIYRKFRASNVSSESGQFPHLVNWSEENITNSFILHVDYSECSKVKTLLPLKICHP